MRNDKKVKSVSKIFFPKTMSPEEITREIRRLIPSKTKKN